MEVIIKDSKLLIITQPKMIYFCLPKDFRKNLKHKIDFIIKRNELLVEPTIKNRIS